MQDPLIQFVATAIVFFFSGFVMGVLLGWLLRLLATQGRRMNEDRCQVDGTTYVAQTYAESTAHCTGCAATAKHLLLSESFRLCQSLGSCAGGYRKDGRNVHWIKEQPESKDA